MKSQTALVARNCRLNEWAKMVHECKNRPAGMSVDEWCELNSITKANYYYRMKQVRVACLDALPSEKFVEKQPGVTHSSCRHLESKSISKRFQRCLRNGWISDLSHH